MKQITRNLLTYSAEIHANADTLRARLPAFTTIGPHQRSSHGFVNVVPDQDERVLVVPGGWAIGLRHDTKGVPVQTINEEVAKHIAAQVAATGHRPTKKDIKEFKAEAIHDLLPQAFARTSLTHILYSTRTQRLYVSTGSQKAADKVMTALVEALESVKTTTVHVSEPKMGLTTRLLNWLDQEDDEDCFGSLEPHAEVVMARKDSKWAVKASSLRVTEATLREAIQGGASVDSIGFMTEDEVKFRITAALRIQGVKHSVVEGVKHSVVEDDKDTYINHSWVSQAASEIVTLDGILDTILELLSPEKAQADDDVSDLF